MKVIQALMIACVCIGSPLWAGDTSCFSPDVDAEAATLANDIGRYIHYFDPSQSSVGAAVAVVKNGKIFMTCGYGIANQETGEGVTDQTEFVIASASKAFTSMGVMMLWDEGLIDLTMPVQSYLPEFRLKTDEWTQAVTPFDLLTHQTGMPPHNMLFYATDYSREELIQRLAGLDAYPYPEQPEVRSGRILYNNLMYTVAGSMAARVAGYPDWESYTRHRILDPLGMSSTRFFEPWSDPQPSNYALGYDHNLYLPTPPGLRQIAPAGGMISNARDMSRWLALLTNRGSYDGVELLSPEGFEVMTSPYVNIAREFNQLGLGWILYRDLTGTNFIYHYGLFDGYSAMIHYSPDLDMGIVIMTNQDFLYRFLWEVIFHVYRDLRYPNLAGYIVGVPGETILPINYYNPFTLFPFYDDSLFNYQEVCSFENSGVDETGQAADSLSGFAGSYFHPGYGQLDVTTNGDNLYLNFGSIEAPLEYRSSSSSGDRHFFLARTSFRGKSLPMPLCFKTLADGTKKLNVIFNEHPFVPMRFELVQSH